ncbi:MAG TPA: serine hydrolase, partial [Thermoanaerobaculia bacterium]|nr:serine hydrolase [Thermoanaerobaculia bacterium]
KLRLDAPFCTYFEGCPDAWNAITVRQLLHHTSGIPDYESELEMGSDDYYAALMRDDSATTAIDQARTRPLDFEPGTKFKYSNTAYLILGFMIERISGTSYENYLRDRLFRPLGMTSTVHIDRTRVQSGRADGYTHEAPLYDTVGGFALTSDHLRRVPALRQKAPQADGGFLSTVDDLHVWARAIIGRGPLGDALLRDLLAPNERGNYAAGWFIGRRFDRDRIHHNGILPGMLSQLDIYPASQTIVIVLCNLDRARLSNISRDLALIALDRPYDDPRAHKVSTIDAARAAQFLGTYQLSDGRVMTIAHDAKNGWLEASVKDQFVAGLLPETDTTFYAPMWEGTITFTGDGLVMRQTGRDIRGERVN